MNPRTNTAPISFQFSPFPRFFYEFIFGRLAWLGKAGGGIPPISYYVKETSALLFWAKEKGGVAILFPP